MQKQKSKWLMKEVNKQVRTFCYTLREFHAVRGEATCLQSHFLFLRRERSRTVRLHVKRKQRGFWYLFFCLHLNKKVFNLHWSHTSFITFKMLDLKTL